MAILKKRTSSKQLPEARGLDRAPLGSVIRNFDDEPSISGGRPNLGTPSGGSSVVSPPSGGISSGTSGGTSGGAGALAPSTSPNRPVVTGGTTKPSLTSTTKPVTTKPAVTTKPITTKPITTKPVVKPTTPTTKPTTPTKPTVTTKTPTTPTTKTTTPTSVVKPVVTKPVTKTNSTTNKVVNAVTGAVLGAGTKMIIDRITGKPTVVKDPAAGGTKQPAGGTVKQPAGPTTKPATGGTKPATGGTKPATGGTKPATSVVKPPSATDIYKGTPADESLGLPKGSIDNGDGTYTSGGLTYDMETGMPLYRENAEGGIDVVTDNNDGTYTIGNTTYSMDNDAVLYTTDADGSITVAGDAKLSPEEVALAQEEGLSAGESIQYANGTTITALDDGNGGVMYVRGGYDTESGLGPKGGNVRGIGGTNTAATDEETNVAGGAGGTDGADDTIVADNNTDSEFYQDDEGNYYTMNEDGGYDLAYYADGSSFEDTPVYDYGDDTVVADNTETEYFKDSLGNVYSQNEDGTYELYANADGSALEDDAYYDDTLLANDTLFEDDTLYAGDPYTSDDYESYDYEDYDYAKRGGLITMMKNGGVPHFEEGGEAYMPEGAIDNNDGTFTIDNEVFDMMTGDPLYTMNDDGEILYVEPSAMSGYVDNEDGTYTMDGITYDVMTDMPLYADREGGGVDLATDNNDGTYTIGNQTYDMETNEPLYTTNPRTRALSVSPTAIRSVGSGPRTQTLGNTLSEGWETAKTLGSDTLNAITGALGTTAGAAGAGALIATLLGEDFTGGGSGAQNQGLDMSQVGVINPRTTDFGIGPTNFVGYDQYGTDSDGYVPNEELLRNLNAPGYNPVNEGDYGYEEVPAEESADEALPAMASGGLSSMSTPVASYYTFGQPADILANLGMRPQPPMNPPDMMPQIGQQQQQQPMQQGQQRGMPQQGMPPQMAQQAPVPQQGMMPQGMPQQMRMGGLPHVSNVPMTQGRMDFRRGSAVHGQGDGQSDDIPAMLADGEYVIDAETVAQIGNGSTKAGAQALDKFREGIRAHKRSAPINKIPPKTKALTSYLKGAS